MTARQQITIAYFAKFRESLGLSQESMLLPDQETLTVQDVLDRLIARGEPYRTLFAPENGLCIALNQEMTRRHSPVQTGDELALFPPVTGG